MGVLGFGLKGRPGEIMTAAYDEEADAQSVTFDMTATRPPIQTEAGFKVEMTVTIEKLAEFRMHIDGILNAAQAHAERKAAQAKAEAEEAAQADTAAAEPAPAKRTRKPRAKKDAHD